MVAFNSRVARSTCPLLLLLATRSAAMAVRPKLTAFKTGPQLQRPIREDPPTTPPGPRDVVVKLYDISKPELVTAFKMLAFKEGWWFPKLSLSVGRRVWSYDGTPNQTYDPIIEGLAGGKPLRTFNCGPTSKSDEEIDAILAQMGATDYTPDEYDFFFRNCNHFCYDLAERLADGGWSESDAAYIENHVLHESEAILSDMPLGKFQQDLTRKVTTQVQKAVINAWRTDWRKSLAEYEEEQGIPSELRIVAPSELV